MAKKVKGKKAVPKNAERTESFVKDILIPLLVGASALFTAIKANQISELQALIAKNTEKPTFEVVGHSFQDHIDSEMEISIDVSVLGGKYDNYQSEIITFLVCRYDDFDENSQWLPFETIEIPVTSYYDTRVNKPSLYGTVETFYTLQNYSALRKLRNSAKMYYESGSDRSFITSLESCLKITYTNLLDETETVYYLPDSDSFGPAARVNAEYGEQRFEKWKSMYECGLHISPYDTVSDLFQVINAVNENGNLYKNPGDTSIASQLNNN